MLFTETQLQQNLYANNIQLVEFEHQSPEEEAEGCGPRVLLSREFLRRGKGALSFFFLFISIKNILEKVIVTFVLRI